MALGDTPKDEAREHTITRACKPTNDRLLPFAFCLLPSAFCLPPFAFRFPPSAFRVLPSAFRLLLSAFRLLPSAFCFLPSAFRLLPSAFRLLPFAFCLLLTLLAGPASSQSLQSKANDIRAAMDARDFERAEALVQSLRASAPAAFSANNYDYLLARLAERRGSKAEAAALYLGVLERGSTLAPYALGRLAGIARASGDLALERQRLIRLYTAFPASLLAAQARDRVIDSLIESGEYRASITLLKPIASVAGARGRSAMARLGDAYAKCGDSDSARSLFNQLVAGARDDYALQAALGLDALDRGAGLRANEFDLLRRARIYLFNRHWAEARADLLSLVERFPDSPNRAEAIYQIGFAFYREDQYDDAIKWFQRAHDEFPAKKEGEQGFYWVATALQKARRYDDAARRYIDFIPAYPNSELIEGAYRNVVDSFRYASRDAEALDWSRRMQQRFAGQGLAAVGLFDEAKIEIVRGNYDTALLLLTRVQALPIYPRLISAPIRGEAGFMRIYALEQMGRLEEAARLYLAMPEERDNYYGHRATLRLRAMAATDAGRRIIEQLARGYRDQARAAQQNGRYGEAKDAANQALRLIVSDDAERDLLAILRTSYAHLPAYAGVSRYRLIPAARPAVDNGRQAPADGSHQTLAAELLFLGLYDEGSTELRLGGFGGARGGARAGPASRDSGNADARDEGSAGLSQSGGDTAYSLAVYNNRGDHSHYAIGFGEPAAKSIPQDFRVELLPRDLAELIYPAPYRDALNQYASTRGVDPRVALALARQESRFNPSAKSPAAARGLLQFIPETALKLAGEEAMKRFELDDVYDPRTAVRLAVRYVADLLKLFPDNPYAVAASYNTGEANVERWIFRAHTSDIDRLVTEIAIPETKDYVAKVMCNYWAYQRLYTPDLRQSN